MWSGWITCGIGEKVKKVKKEKTINLEAVEYLVKRFTDSEVTDATADRDALEAIVAWLIGDDTYILASAMINKWRKEKIAQDAQFDQLENGVQNGSHS